jgi:hypothetical protein
VMSAAAGAEAYMKPGAGGITGSADSWRALDAPALLAAAERVGQCWL